MAGSITTVDVVTFCIKLPVSCVPFNSNLTDTCHSHQSRPLGNSSLLNIFLVSHCASFHILHSPIHFSFLILITYHNHIALFFARSFSLSQSYRMLFLLLLQHTYRTIFYFHFANDHKIPSDNLDNAFNLPHTFS